MKAASIHELRKEVSFRSQQELEELLLRMARFKKENKELLTYLVFEAQQEEKFVEERKSEITGAFREINRSNYYYIKKSVRKILKQVRKYCRYSSEKETEVALHLYFCQELRAMKPPLEGSKVLANIFKREQQFIRTKLKKLHPDLQFDYLPELEKLSK